VNQNLPVRNLLQIIAKFRRLPSGRVFVHETNGKTPLFKVYSTGGCRRAIEMISKSTAAKRVLGLATTAAFFAMGGSANARDPAYVGKWAKTAAACKKPSDTLDAPTVLKARSYDQFETHCDFTSVANQVFRWRAKVRCQVEGTVQTDTLTMSVSGRALTYRWGQGGRAQTLKRC
jgi:hypothetical protein